MEEAMLQASLYRCRRSYRKRRRLASKARERKGLFGAAGGVVYAVVNLPTVPALVFAGAS